MSINGARATANNWTVDGSDINDSGSNGTVINAPNIDAIQEFTLARGTYDAGYGRSGGGQVVVATKSGTSAFHGTAYEFLRNTALDANEWFNKRSQIQNGEPNKNPVNHHNVYGFTIGGPIFIPERLQHQQEQDLFLLVGGMEKDQLSRWRQHACGNAGHAERRGSGQLHQRSRRLCDL